MRQARHSASKSITSRSLSGARTGFLSIPSCRMRRKKGTAAGSSFSSKGIRNWSECGAEGSTRTTSSMKFAYVPALWSGCDCSITHLGSGNSRRTSSGSLSGKISCLLAALIRHIARFSNRFGPRRPRTSSVCGTILVSLCLPVTTRTSELARPQSRVRCTNDVL